MSQNRNRLIFGILASLFAGCGLELADEANTLDERDNLTAREDLGVNAEAVLLLPATVVTEGNGCPVPETVAVRPGLNPGETTVLLAANTATTQPGVERVQTDCKITLTYPPAADGGLQFAMSTFKWGAMTNLEKGTSAKISVNYKLGNFRQRDVDKAEIVGPHTDGAFDSDEVGPPDQEWTKCKEAPIIRIHSRIVLKNNKPNKAVGSTRLTAFGFALQSRGCTP